MKLIKLQIKNFGCIGDKTVVFGDRLTTISGGNGSGKSTIKNAFFWVMGADAGVKPRPIKSDGSLDTAAVPDVSLTMTGVDGETLEIRRKLVAKESALGEIKDTSVFYINDFETSKKDYLAKIQFHLNLDDVTYQFVINPELFFVGTANERRQKLLDLLCIHDADFVTDEIKAALKGNTVETALANTKKELKELDKRLVEIPKQIEEAGRNIPDISESRDALVKKSDELSAKIAAMEKNYDATKLAEASAAYEKAVDEFDRMGKALKADQYQLETTLTALRNSVDETAETVADLQQKRKNARDEYLETKNSSYDGSPNCPTCGHPLPEALLNSYVEKFNQTKAEALEALKVRGTKIGERIKQLEAQLEELKSKEAGKTQELEDLLTTRTAAIDKQKQKCQELKLAFESASNEMNVSVYSDPKYQELIKQRSEAVTTLLKLDVADEQRKRVKELEDLLSNTNKAYYDKMDSQEKILNARRKIGEALEKAVNDKFRFVQWKLTETNKDGTIADACTALVNGVSYLGSLNSGAKILALCDCFNVVVGSRFSVPLWIDNAEQVTSWEAVPVNENGQIIKLYAVDKPLEIKGE